MCSCAQIIAQFGRQNRQIALYWYNEEIFCIEKLIFIYTLPIVCYLLQYISHICVLELRICRSHTCDSVTALMRCHSNAHHLKMRYELCSSATGCLQTCYICPSMPYNMCSIPMYSMCWNSPVFRGSKLIG